MKPETIAEKYELKYPFPAAGDVILCRGGSKSRWIVEAQQLVRWGRRVRHSHVALHINNFVVHAMPGQGVHAVPVTKFFLRLGLRDDWQVFRHFTRDEPDVQQNASAGAEVYSRAQYFVGQLYNRRFLLPKLHGLFATVDDSAFCSELVCRVYEGSPARKTIRQRRASAVLPADIERAVTSSHEWVDVTSIYRRDVDSARSGGTRRIDSLINNQLSQAEYFENFAKLMTHFAKHTLDQAANIEKFKLLSIQFNRRLGLPEKPAPAQSSNLEELSKLNWRVARVAAANRRQVERLKRKLDRKGRR